MCKLNGLFKKSNFGCESNKTVLSSLNKVRDLLKGYQGISHQSPKRAKSWAFLRPAAAGGCGLPLVTNDSQCQHCLVLCPQFNTARKESLFSPGTDALSWLITSEGCWVTSLGIGGSVLKMDGVTQPSQEVLLQSFLGHLFQRRQLRGRERDHKGRQ